MRLNLILIAYNTLILISIVHLIPPCKTKPIKYSTRHDRILDFESNFNDIHFNESDLDTNYDNTIAKRSPLSGNWKTNQDSSSNRVLKANKGPKNNGPKGNNPNDNDNENNRKSHSYIHDLLKPIKHSWCNPTVIPLTARTTLRTYMFGLTIFMILLFCHLIKCRFMANYGWSSFTLNKLWNLITNTGSEIDIDPEFNTSQVLNNLRIVGYSESKVGTAAYRVLALIVIISHLIVYYLIANELCLNVEASVHLWDIRARGYILNCALSVLMIALYYILSGNDGILFLQVAPLSSCTYILVGKVSESQKNTSRKSFGYRHFNEGSRATIFGFERNITSLLLLLFKLFACRSFWNCHYKIVKIDTENYEGKRGTIRRFKHECMHYFYNSSLDLFVDSSEPMKNYLDYTNLSDLMKNGGLTDTEASERINSIGLNEIDIEMPKFSDILRREVTDYIFLVQLFVTYKSLYWRNLITAPIWATIVFLNIMNKALLISRRQSEVQSLAGKNSTSYVDVLRNNAPIRILAKHLTVGDIVRVKPDWLVPCDMVLLRGTVSMDESTLTGESVPVQKTQLPSISVNPTIRYGDSSRMSYLDGGKDLPCRTYPHEHVLKAGTRVVAIVGSDESSFETVAVVIATGAYTLKGKQIKGMLFPSQIQLKYDAQLPLTIFLTSIYALICSLYQGSVLGWNMTSVFYGIGTFAQVIPLWTPTIVSIGQNKACERLLYEHKIRCTAPARVAICGKIRIMCFDKTGTITEPGLSFSGFYSEKSKSNSNIPCQINLDDLQNLTVSNTYSELNNVNLMILGMSLCHSLIPDQDGVSGLHAEKRLEIGTDRDGDSHRSIYISQDRKIDVVKVFDFCHHLKTSSVIVSIPDFIKCNSGDYLVFCKGSFEAVSAACTATPPSEETKLALQKFCSQGLYTIALAYKVISDHMDPDSPMVIMKKDSLGPEIPHKLIKATRRDHVECDLHFLGLLIFRNQLRPDACYVFNTLRQVKVRPVILTGDDPLTAISVAEEVGIIQDSSSDVISNPLKHELVIGRLEHQNGVVWRFVESNMLIDDYEIYSSDFFTDLIITGDAFDYLSSNWTQIISNAVSGNSRSIGPVGVFDWGNLWYQGKTEAPDQVYFEKLLLRIRLFARLQPDQKARIVKAFNSLGIITGMCGDGNNDCGALQESHAGISLSEGEASIVSPFTSTTHQLSSVIDLIREGRASLVTSLSCYKFMLLYGFLIALVKILLFRSCKAVMPEWGYLVLDNLIVITLSRAMANSRSSDQLRIRSPTSSLLGPQTIISAGVMLIVNVAYMGILFYVLDLPSSKEFNKDIPPFAWWKLSDNYEAPAVCLWLCYQVTNAAMVFSFGGIFREAVFYNYGLTFWWFSINSFLTALILGKPSLLSCMFRINCTDAISRRTIIPVIKHLSPSCNGMPFHGQLGHNILTTKFKKIFSLINILNVLTNVLVAKFFILGALSARIRKYVHHRCSADRITV